MPSPRRNNQRKPIEKRPKRRRSKKSNNTATGLGIGGLILSIALIFGISMCNRTQDDGAILREMQSAITEHPNYSADPEYYQSLLIRAHNDAFGKHYQMRKRGNKFDEIGYFNDVVSIMRSIAQREGRDDIAATLIR